MSGSVSQSCDTFDIGEVDKFKILKNCFKPREQFNFAKKLLQGSHISYKVKYPCDTFVHSKYEDGVY